MTESSVINILSIQAVVPTSMLEMSVKYIGRQGIVLLNCIVSCFLFILSHWLGICDGIDGIVDFTFMFSFLFASYVRTIKCVHVFTFYKGR